jgi:hypothetical protein
VTAPWWAALRPAETRISCGTGQHALRWADGRLTAADHPDAEGELVLAALGGDKAECVAVVEAWGAHRDDLDVLALGPRSPADELAVTWDMVQDLRSMLSHRQGRMTGRAYSGWVGRPPVARPAAQRIRSMPMRHLSPEAERVQARRADLLSLFALGRDFQLALAGEVAAAWSAPGRRPGGPATSPPAPAHDLAAARPALTAALTGRLAPVAAAWLGIEPDQVQASPHEGPGWGRAELDGSTLRAALPVSWLARVWAAGCPVVGGHLVVDVLDAAWPQARVSGLREPGAEPAVLSINHDGEHWTVAAGAS